MVQIQVEIVLDAQGSAGACERMHASALSESLFFWHEFASRTRLEVVVKHLKVPGESAYQCLGQLCLSPSRMGIGYRFERSPELPEQRDPGDWRISTQAGLSHDRCHSPQPMHSRAIRIEVAWSMLCRSS